MTISLTEGLALTAGTAYYLAIQVDATAFQQIYWMGSTAVSYSNNAPFAMAWVSTGLGSPSTTMVTSFTPSNQTVSNRYWLQAF